MAAEVFPLHPKMSRPLALQRIRELAGDTENVVPGPEAPKRMKQRKITWAEIIKVLQNGQITEGPAMDPKGCWRCTVERFAAGEDLKVVVAICEGTLVVVTAF